MFLVMNISLEGRSIGQQFSRLRSSKYFIYRNYELKVSYYGLSKCIMLAQIVLLNGIFVTNYNIDGFLKDNQIEFLRSLFYILLHFVLKL